MATRQATARMTQQELRERGAHATGKLREAVGLPSNLTDTAILGTALAEIATEESRRNPGFAKAVRSRYDEIVSLRGATQGTTRPAKEPLPELVPIGNIPGYQSDPFSPPKPDVLIRIYGRAQLARALHDYTVEALKETAAQYEAKYPGTKPTNRGQRAPLIAYIVKQSSKE